MSYAIYYQLVNIFTKSVLHFLDLAILDFVRFPFHFQKTAKKLLQGKFVSKLQETISHTFIFSHY